MWNLEHTLVTPHVLDISKMKMRCNLPCGPLSMSFVELDWQIVKCVSGETNV